MARPGPNPRSSIWKSNGRLEDAFIVDPGEGFVPSTSQPFQYVGSITIQYVGPVNMEYV